MTEYEERCVRQYKSHTKVRTDGSLLVRIDHGLWDVFFGSGWKNQSRFRLVKSRSGSPSQLIGISGVYLDKQTREQLLKECMT